MTVYCQRNGGQEAGGQDTYWTNDSGMSLAVVHSSSTDRRFYRHSLFVCLRTGKQEFYSVSTRLDVRLYESLLARYAAIQRVYVLLPGGESQ